MRIDMIARYTRWGWALAPAPPGSKGPRYPGWNRPGGYFTDPEQVSEYWTKNPDHNIILVHGPSRTAALDIDHMPLAVRAFRALGISLGSIYAQSPIRIRGRRSEKPLYRLPEDIQLPLRKLTWKLPKGGETTIFELRAGFVGEVLPPSTHPDTGRPYRWTQVPARLEDVPYIPKQLLDVWLHWDHYIEAMRDAAPWPQPKPQYSFPRGEELLSPDELNYRRLRNYALSALEGEARRVASTPPNSGNRNNQLNRSAFTLGGWVAHQLLNPQEVLQALLDAALQCGLGEREATATIRSGLQAGMRRPHRLEGRFKKKVS